LPFLGGATDRDIAGNWNGCVRGWRNKQRRRNQRNREKPPTRAKKAGQGLFAAIRKKFCALSRDGKCQVKTHYRVTNVRLIALVLYSSD
jgi:hypothetical protein